MHNTSSSRISITEQAIHITESNGKEEKLIS